MTLPVNFILQIPTKTNNGCTSVKFKQILFITIFLLTLSFIFANEIPEDKSPDTNTDLVRIVDFRFFFNFRDRTQITAKIYPVDQFGEMIYGYYSHRETLIKNKNKKLKDLIAKSTDNTVSRYSGMIDIDDITKLALLKLKANIFLGLSMAFVGTGLTILANSLTSLIQFPIGDFQWNENDPRQKIIEYSGIYSRFSSLFFLQATINGGIFLILGLIFTAILGNTIFKMRKLKNKILYLLDGESAIALKKHKVTVSPLGIIINL